MAYQAQVLQAALEPSHEVMAAQDASFLPKSGRQTYGLDRFFNGCAGRPERGLEINALAMIDVTQKGAYVASVVQTPATPALKNDQAEATRLEHAIAQLRAARPRLPKAIK